VVVTIQPIEIVLPGHFVPGVGRRPKKDDFSQRLNKLRVVHASSTCHAPRNLF